MIFSESVSELSNILSNMNVTHFDQKINRIAVELSEAFQNKSKLMLAGNGGSAAEAQHMAAEYVATLKSSNYRNGLPALALSVDSSFLTAWSNDFEFDNVFSRQIDVFGGPNDVLFAYSTSGKSTNIINAIKSAQNIGMFVVGFTGKNGTPIESICDECFKVPSVNTARIQEVHTILGHSICKSTELKLGYDFIE